MAEYYVVRDKNTGLYFRGKGVNRWGKYYNQASIYRIKANAENTIKEVSWRGEQAEIVPIQIVETTADVVPKSEVGQWKILVEAQRKRIDELNKSKAEVARAFRQRMNEKMGKHTHLLGKEYVQRIMREIEKEFSEVENDR